MEAPYAMITSTNALTDRNGSGDGSESRPTEISINHGQKEAKRRAQSNSAVSVIDMGIRQEEFDSACSLLRKISGEEINVLKEIHEHLLKDDEPAPFGVPKVRIYPLERRT